jgi:TetR/AcrR family transcriptional regulator, cholesterol catabolism regulator
MSHPAPPARAQRADNRLAPLLDAAAAQFALKGYEAASIRDIVRAVGMLPGSLYYHFANKDELLVAVYAEGVRRIGETVTAAIEHHADPWDRLEAACTAHLESLLDRSAYAKVVIAVQPDGVPSVEDKLVALRDSYERLFVALIDALPLPPRTPRTTLRMLLLGALNWTPTWFRAGSSSPQRIARGYLQLLADRSSAGDAPTRRK